MQPERIVIEIENPGDNPFKKYRKADAILRKSLLGSSKFDRKRAPKEVSPFRSERELLALTLNRVERRLYWLYSDLVSELFGVEKAKREKLFRYRGKTVLNPKTGKPLTVKEWSEIKKKLTRALYTVYGDEETRLVREAAALGKILATWESREEFDRSINTPIKNIDLSPKRRKRMWTKEYERNALQFARQEAGQHIVELTERQFNKIHSTIVEAQKARMSPHELDSKLFDQFGDMNRDWYRIATTEMHNNVNNGRLLQRLGQRRDQEPAFMKGVSAAEACDWCREHINGKIVVLLESPPEGGGDTLEVNGEEYTAIWPGKSNVGRKKANWWVSAGTQHPHTYSKDTEVFTDSGWKLFPELDGHDKIMAINPETKEIDFVSYVSFVEHYQEKMVRLSGRNYDLMVTPEHRQLYRGKHDNLKEASVGEITQLSEFSLPRAIGEWKASEYTPAYGLSEEQYARLWAWFLADGCVSERDSGLLQVYIGQKDNSNIQQDLGGLVSAGGYVAADVKEMFRPFIGVRAWDKWIPDSVKALSKEALVAFIDSYSHSDGHNRKGKPGHRTSYSAVRGDSISIYTTSRSLMNDLTEVAVKAGYIPSFRTQEPTGKAIDFPNGKYETKRDVYVLGLCTSRYRRFSKSMGVGKIETVDYYDTAYDVELEKWHHLLVRRNGKVAWSGNCACIWVSYTPGFEKYHKQLEEAMDEATEEWYAEHPGEAARKLWDEDQARQDREDRLRKLQEKRRRLRSGS